MVQSPPDRPLVILNETLQRMRDLSDVKALIDLSLECVRRIFPAPLIWLALYDPSNHQLLGQGGSTLLEDDSILRKPQPLQPGEILEQVVVEQRPFSIPDMSSESRMGFWQRKAKELGRVEAGGIQIQGCLIYPIKAPRRCLGVLMLGSQVWGISTGEEEKALLGILLGQLSYSLTDLETLWRQQNERRIEDPLLSLAVTLRNLNSLEERLQAVAEQLQAFIGIGRVQIYWFDRQESHFTLRWGTRLAKRTTQPHAQILTSRDLGDMYLMLMDGQLVVANEGMGTARSEVTPKLMQQLQAQAILAAPILFEGDLLGFINLESETPRVWQDAERQMVVGAANLLSLVAPLEQQELALVRIQQDQMQLSQIARSIYTQADLYRALQQAISSLCQRLNASTCLVLSYHPTSQTFTLFYEYRNPNAARERKLQAFPQRFKPLSEQDWNDLMRLDAIVAENFSQDLRLLSWHAELEQAGVRSLLMAHTGTELQHSHRTIEGAVLVTHQQLRAWNREEQQLVRLVAQQLGVILRQSQLEDLQQRQARVYTNLVNAMLPLQTLTSVDEVLDLTTRSSAQILSAPLALLVHWLPADSVGRVMANGSEFALTATEVDIFQDPLIGYCLQAETAVELMVADLPAPTQLWLSTPGLGRILVVPLSPPEAGISVASALGVLLVGVEADRLFEPYEHLALQLVAQTCGWTLRRLLWTQSLQERSETLTELNWYKNRRLFDVHQTVGDNLRRLKELASDSQDPRWNKVVEVTRTLRDTISPLQALLKSETWKVALESRPIPSASLIRRSLRRVESLIQSRKLWPRVHGDTSVTIRGDLGRLEMVVYELLLTAVLRSSEGSRLDIWSQQNAGHLELVVVDGGPFDPRLLQALQVDPYLQADPLAPSLLALSPGLDLNICQRVVARLGGQLSFLQSQDGRNIARLLLPLSQDSAGSANPDL